MNQLCIIENPGKGEISRVMALHVKTESVGYRRQSLERSVGLFAGGIRPQQSGFVASQISDHEISKSAIGNWQIGNRNPNTYVS